MIPSWTLGASECKRLIEGDLPTLFLSLQGLVPRRTKAEAAAETAAKLQAIGARGIDVDMLELSMWMGDALEETNQMWFTHKTGLKIERLQERIRHHRLPLHATVDGVVDAPDWSLPFEGKTTSESTSLPALLRREQPQLQAQMMCLSAPECLVSVLWRKPRWAGVAVAADLSVQDEIADRLTLLADFIAMGTAPPTLPPFPCPEPVWRVLPAQTVPTMADAGTTEP